MLAIVTTIYYKISWLASFSEEKTASGTFHAAGGDVTCEFLNRTGEMNYVDGDGYSAVYLPTSDGEICDGGMWLILPELRVEFVLDRPFLFVITSGNAELFAGVVNQS